MSTIINFFLNIILTISLMFNLTASSAQPKVANLNVVGAYHVVQGGCTDGKYAYIAMHNNMKGIASDLAENAILKVDTETWKTVKTYTQIKSGHSNDLCYNPNTNELFIVKSSGGPEYAAVYDAETMEFKRDQRFPVSISSIAYSAKENCYYVAVYGSFNLAKISADFKLIDEYKGEKVNSTRQGIEVYGDYIYYLMSEPNCILIYDTNGNYIETYQLPVQKGEAENIFCVDGTMYVSYFYSTIGGAIFKLKDFKLK